MTSVPGLKETKRCNCPEGGAQKGFYFRAVTGRIKKGEKREVKKEGFVVSCGDSWHTMGRARLRNINLHARTNIAELGHHRVF